MIVKCLVHMTVEQSFPSYGIVFYVGSWAPAFFVWICCLNLPPFMDEYESLWGGMHFNNYAFQGRTVTLFIYDLSLSKSLFSDGFIK